MNIYVGNLPFSTTEDELRDLFGTHGEVKSANIIQDKFSGRSKGFAFVEMADATAGAAAVEALNQAELGGRNIKVSEAKPREERPRRPRQDRY